jgi:DNA polymerase III sliding clamp (beta) subunit (PCNA family)
MPRTPKVPTLTVGADELREALALVIHAVRFVLESVYFEVTRPRGKPINLRLVAADNYRIAWANVVNPAPPADPVVTADKAFASFMLPIDIATALVKDLKPPKVGIKRDSVEIAVTDAFGSIVQGGNVRSFQPVGGHFPNYAAIIPTRKPRFTVGVSGKYLADVAKAFGDANVLVLELTGDPLKPITVRSHGKPNHGSVIMPTRLGGS